MKAVFADTFYFLALDNPNDTAHRLALAASRGRIVNLITTAWVLAEVGNALSVPPDRIRFLELMDYLKGDLHVVIVPPSQELFDAGIELFRKRPDKSWSITDCVSFVVMKERCITEALTGDRHFEQAGFKALLKREE